VRLLRRLDEREGQGVFEVVIVFVVIAAMAVATPAYLHVVGQRADTSAQHDLVTGAKAANSYLWAHGSFRGMTNVDLVRQQTGVSSSTTVVWTRRHSYCLAATVRGHTWSLQGPYTSSPKFLTSSDCS
jgi:Tfp pilus assembly protein PilE